ncbi:MAG: asparaginase [Clostridiales bacterium]|nr:asparaginase [Clostridiales bacterium]
MKKVAIVFTGGTISMKVDPRLAAAIPALSSEEIMSMVTNLDKMSAIEIINFSRLPGPHMTPAKIMELSNLIKELVARDDITGVVVTHGTDSLEETAFLIDLNVITDKPIVMVAAMRSASELGFDGPSNIASAIATAASDNARGKGCLVVLNNEVNAASEVTKSHTLSLNTFRSLEFGPLGVVDNDEVIFYRDMTRHDYIDVNSIEENVSLIKAVVGLDSGFLRYAVDHGAKGIVIEAMGRGNIPPTMLDGVDYALSKDVKIVLVSRCPMGRVLDSYGYEGAGKDLRNRGVIFAGNLNGQKARIKLMLSLAKTEDYKTIKEIFEMGIY